MFTADFWLKKYPDPEKELVTKKELALLNQQAYQRLPDFLCDLAQHPAYLPAETVAAMIAENELPVEPRYIGGLAVTAPYYMALSQAMNTETLQGTVKAAYGYTVRRTSVRTFPTNDFISKTPEDREFDRFQETALDPAEPLIILHHSADARWCFIQAGNYRGWVETDDIAATADRALWQKYLEMPDFLVVTGNRLILGNEPHAPECSGLHFAMGARLPLLPTEDIPALIANRSPAGCHAVLLPVRDQDGGLGFRPALVPLSADVHQGYLPFSRANLVRQAFKLQGDRYGWGGLFGSRDCSALVLDVYRSVGLVMARNAGEQAQGAGTPLSLAGSDQALRQSVLRELPPGSTLHCPGHVMFYLGEHNGDFYVIHAIAACGDPARPLPDGTLTPIPLNGIMVTSLSLPRASGITLLDSLTETNRIP